MDNKDYKYILINQLKNKINEGLEKLELAGIETPEYKNILSNIMTARAAIYELNLEIKHEEEESKCEMESDK